MTTSYLEIQSSGPLQGTASVYGAKNAVLVSMASLLLASGKSKLTNIPASADVMHMISLLQDLGAHVAFDESAHELMVDTSFVDKWCVSPSIMKKMRASILVMGPLLARFLRADIALPGGCVIGPRPIDYHLKNFVKMGVVIEQHEDFLKAYTSKLLGQTLILDYPSVGATENLMMAATLARGRTTIINAALEPEVLNLVEILQKMGALISIQAPATLIIDGVSELYPIEHEIIPDRLEAGALLCAAAITGGSIILQNVRADHMDVFLLKLQEMGHSITADTTTIHFKAHSDPAAVSFKTSSYPGFPTDMQAPMMSLQAVAQGKCTINETVFENRMLHVKELQKMGAQIVVDGSYAHITGVDALYGAYVIASDIRAACALVLAGLVAKGTTIMMGIHHWERGYDALEKKLAMLGASIALKQTTQENISSLERNYYKEKLL